MGLSIEIIETVVRKSLFAMIAIVIVGAQASAAIPAGRAVTVIGNVTVRRAGSQTAEALRPAMTISKGDQVETAANGKAKLLMSDKTVIDLSASTTFKVDEFKGTTGEREVGLSVDQGKIRTAVSEPLTGKGKFIIKTKTTTMGVRGTEFVVASQLASAATAGQKTSQVNTEITVVNGKVDVTDKSAPGGQAISLTAGKQLVSTANVDLSSGQVMRIPSSAGAGAPGSGGNGGASVREVPSSQMDQIRSESKVNDISLKDTVNIEDKSRPREAPAAPSSQSQASSGQSQGSGGSKSASSESGSSSGSGNNGGASGGSDGQRAPAAEGGGGAPGFSAVGNLDAAITTAVNQNLSPTGPGVGGFGAFVPPKLGDIATGASNTTLPTFGTNVIQPTTGNVNIKVQFKP